jgi:hypothetical protein
MGRYGARAETPAWRNPVVNAFALPQSIDFSGLADTAAMSAALEALFPTDFGLGNATLDTVNTLDGHPTMRIPVPSGFPYGVAQLGQNYDRIWLRAGILIPADATATGELNLGDTNSYPSFSPYVVGKYDLANQRWEASVSSVDRVAVSQPLADIKGTWIYPLYRIDSDGTFVLFLNGLPAFTSAVFTTGAFNAVSLESHTSAIPFNLGVLEYAVGDNPYNLPDPGSYEPTITLEPAEWLVAASGTKQFAAFADGIAIPATSVTWGGTGGTFDANGLYTAGAVEGVYAVTASFQGGEATAPIEVGDFVPEDLSPWAQHRFDDLAGANDDPIGIVPDVGGEPLRGLYGNADGDEKRPLLKTNVLNGHDVSEGDGVDDLLRMTVPVPWGARTTFIMGRMMSAEFLGKVVFALSGGYVRVAEASTGWQAVIFTSDTIPLGGTRTDWTLFALRFNSPTSLTLWRDNQRFNITLIAAAYDDSPNSQLHDMHRHDTDDNAHSQIFDPVHYDTALSDADVARVRRYYNSVAGGIY